MVAIVARRAALEAVAPLAEKIADAMKIIAESARQTAEDKEQVLSLTDELERRRRRDGASGR